MNKIKSSNLIFVLTALVLIFSFISPLIATNSWFTSKGYSIQCTIKVGSNFTIYQNIGGKEQNVTTSLDETKFINLTFTNSKGESVTQVKPDESYGLNLLVKNAETAPTSSSLRFKAEFYACGATTELLNSTISGFTAPTSTAGGFVLSSDGWFYYQNNSGKTIPFASGTTATLLANFSIPYSDFYNRKLNGNNLKLVLTVENATTGLTPTPKG